MAREPPEILSGRLPTNLPWIESYPYACGIPGQGSFAVPLKAEVWAAAGLAVVVEEASCQQQWSLNPSIVHTNFCFLSVWKICLRYGSQLTNSFSCGSCNLWVLMYCHRALMLTGLVSVCTPSSWASLVSSLSWKRRTRKTNERIITAQHNDRVCQSWKLVTWKDIITLITWCWREFASSAQSWALRLGPICKNINILFPVTLVTLFYLSGKTLF